MIKDIKRNFKIIILLMCICLFFVGIDATKAAEVVEASYNVQTTSIEKHLEENSLKVKNLADSKASKEIKSIKLTRSQVMISSPVLYENESLTAQDPSDFRFFDVTSNRTMVMNMTSTNPNYVAQLGIVDWQNGTFTGTNVYVFSGQEIKLNNLPAGSYGIRIFSNNNTVGQSYTIRMNALNPGGDGSTIIQKSSSLRYIVMQYINKDIFANGKFVANLSRSNPELKWTREFYFPTGGGYTSRKHDIDEARVKSVSAPVSYKSSYASSNNAILVYLERDTLFTYFESAYQSGVSTAYYNSFIDTLGKKTPRRLDVDDMTNNGDHILVVDLDSGKPIDFFSVLNYYYASGVEPIPTINFLN